jgi:hypothetical protein
MLARMGWGLLSLCQVYVAYHAYKWIWPRNLPEEAPISTCLEFYRRELERRRDYPHRWWRSGLPVFLLLGMVMAAVGTGARNAALQHPLLNALPFFLILAIWAVAFLLMRKKLGGIFNGRSRNCARLKERTGDDGNLASPSAFGASRTAWVTTVKQSWVNSLAPKRRLCSGSCARGPRKNIAIIGHGVG